MLMNQASASIQVSEALSLGALAMKGVARSTRSKPRPSRRGWSLFEPNLVDEIGTDLLGGLFERRQDMLLAGPLINLERVQTLQGTIIALPLNVPEACSASARILFVEGVKLSG